MLKNPILTMWTLSGVSGLLMLSAGMHILVPDSNMFAKELNVIILRTIYYFLQHMRGLCVIFMFRCHCSHLGETCVGVQRSARGVTGSARHFCVVVLAWLHS